MGCCGRNSFVLFMFIYTDVSDSSQKSQCSNLETKIVAANFLYTLLIELKATPWILSLEQSVYLSKFHFLHQDTGDVKTGRKLAFFLVCFWKGQEGRRLSLTYSRMVVHDIPCQGKEIWEASVCPKRLRLSSVNCLCSSVSQCWAWTLKFV